MTVQYATANGTETYGSDYQAVGKTTGTITVRVIGDRLPEPNKDFFVNLSGATGAIFAGGQPVTMSFRRVNGTATTGNND